MIERIRKHRWMLMVMVGLGLLSFLIPFDAVNSMLGGSNPNVGVVNGHEVTSQEWSNTLKLLTPLFKDKQVTDGNQINDLTWQYLTDKYLYEDLAADANISMNDDLMEELLFGTTVPTLVTQLVYNGAEINDTFRDSIRTEFSTNPGLGAAYRAWIGENYNKSLIESMVNKSIYANMADAKLAFQENNNLAVVDFVFKSYAEIPDSTVQYTDADLRDFYDKHKNDRKYRQIQGRDVEYVAFSTNPTASDSALVKDELTELLPTFRATENDSMFAKTNAQTPIGAFDVYEDKSFTAEIENVIKSAGIDSIIGPFASGNSMNLVKIISRGVNTEEVSVKHILMRDKIMGAKILDSLNKTLSTGGSFDAIARLNEDQATKQTNGDMGNKKKTELTTAYGAAFADAVFAMSQG
ncbi:MAG: SurA N-terminal domain-containing protein, partial [Flavobacteriales bacterium]